MDKNNNYISGLIELGMSEREAKVYLALINKHNASITDLQKLSGVRSNKMSEVINSLVRQGLCSEKKVGQRRYFNALDPGSSLKPVLEEIEIRLEKGNKLRKDLCKLFESVEEVKEPFEYIEIAHGNENIHRKYLELLRTAKTEILGFTRPPFACISEKMVEEQRKAFRDYLKRGGISKDIYETHENSPPRMFDHTYEAYKSDDKFRIVLKLPLKMFIFDRKTLLIAESESFIRGNELIMTVIRQKATVDGYIALFDFFWEQGAEYEQWIKGKERLMERKLAEFEKSFA